LNEIKAGRINVAKLSKETGIPAGRMYKWKDRGSKITSEDAEILKNWIRQFDNSPKNASVGPQEPQGGQKNHSAETKPIHKLTNSTSTPVFDMKSGNGIDKDVIIKTQADTLKSQVETNRILAIKLVELATKVIEKL